MNHHSETDFQAESARLKKENERLAQRIRALGYWCAVMHYIANRGYIEAEALLLIYEMIDNDWDDEALEKALGR